MRRAVIGSIASVLLAASVSCDNAGADRSLGVDATGLVTGSIFFDANGSGTSDAQDAPFEGARVRLLTPASRDTVLRATTGIDGRFSFGQVPVGSYAIVLDSLSGGDSISVVTIEETVTVHPADSIEVTGSFGFRSHPASAIRTLPLGTRVFVTAVALHARGTFSDTLLHVADTSGAIRASRIRPSSAPAVAGDSVRLRARVGERLGERTLDDVTVFVVTPTFVPTVSPLTTLEASGALGGVLDAALVQVIDALVTDTATVGGHVTMTVDDGSGELTVVLDRAADGAFRAPLPAGLYQAGNRFDLVGVLVPTGTGGFVLRPRSALDLTLR